MSRSTQEKPPRWRYGKAGWVRRAGRLGFAFFFLKGVVWLLLPATIWLLD